MRQFYVFLAREHHSERDLLRDQAAHSGIFDAGDLLAFQDYRSTIKRQCGAVVTG